MKTTTLLAALLLAAAAQAEEVVVVQKDKAFSTGTITIKPGDTVTFKNEDPINHNAFSLTPGLEFNLKSPPGASPSVTLTKEGTAQVRCAFHPSMKLTIVVKP